MVSEYGCGSTQERNTVTKVMSCGDRDWLMSEEAFSIYSPCLYHRTYEDYKAWIEDCLSDPAVKIFVCEYRGRKRGMMVLKLSEAHGEIIGIAVSENARRKGIGRQMIRSVTESGNLESLTARTDDDSIGFYRRCGFSKERILMEYPDGTAVRYNCVLCRQTAAC